MNTSLGYNSNGCLNTKLPKGADYDSNKIYLAVKITDDRGGFTVFNLAKPVVVTLNYKYAKDTIDQISSMNTSSAYLISLFNGNTQESLQTILGLSSILNGMSVLEKKSLATKKTFLTTFGPERNIGFNLNFNDIKGLNPAFAAVGNVIMLFNLIYFRKFNFFILI